MRESKQPSWWSLNGIVIAAALLLWWEGRAQLTPPRRQLILVGIVFLVYGLIAWWIRVNQVALDRKRGEEWFGARPGLRVVKSIGLEARNGNHRIAGPTTPVHTRSSSAGERGMHKGDRPAGPWYPTGQAHH